jgi:hypothetical protein
VPVPLELKVIFRRVYVIDDGDWLGSGEFYFNADVAGTAVGNRRVFDAVEGTWINLPRPSGPRPPSMYGRGPRW